jgi:hypothetical protein
MSAEPIQVTSEGRTVAVYVIAKPGPTPDSVTFRLDSDLIDGNDETDELVFDQDRDDMLKLDYYLVEFKLVDRTRLGLRFSPDKKDAFWVVTGPVDAPNPPCPTTPSYTEEIHAIDVERGRLIVRNENNTVANFTYSLGFLTREGKAIRFDPGGINKDGGR